MKILKTIGSKIKCLEVKAEKNSPEIKLVLGLIGIGVGFGLACRASMKAKTVLDESKEQIETIKNTNDQETVENEEIIKTEVNKVRLHTGLQMVKIYSIPVGVTVLSVLSIISSHRTLNERNASLSAAYMTIDQAYKKYRKNVIDKYGEEADKELRYDVTEEVDEETGETKKTYSIDADYSRIFDESNIYWKPDADYNLNFLVCQLAWCNDKLTAEKILFLNDVYECLGMEKTKAGQIIGWVYDKNSQTSKIDFGKDFNEALKIAASGPAIERNIWLDFNVDGEVWSNLDKLC